MGSHESGERGEGGHGKHKGVVIEVKILLTLPPTVTRPTTVPSDPSGHTQHSLPHPHSDVQPRSHPPHDSTTNNSMLRPPQRFLSGTRAFKQLINCYRTSRGFLFIQSCIQTLFNIRKSDGDHQLHQRIVQALHPRHVKSPLHARSPNHTVVSSRSRILQDQLVSWPPDSDRAQREGLRISSRFLFPPCRSVTGGFFFFLFVSALVLSTGWGYWDCEV